MFPASRITRRETLQAGAVALLGGLVPNSAAPAETAPKHERLPGHRNLFNGDCTFLFGDEFVADLKGKYERENLHWFIDLLADCGVDTYVNNPIAQVPWYPSKRTPNILTGYKRGDREFFRRHFRVGAAKDKVEKAMDEEARRLNRYLDLAEAGVNWVAEISKACRRRKLSPWLSIRMNDVHGANSWEGSYMNCALLRNPKYRLGGREINPRDGVNRMLQSLDYSHREVRDYMLLVIRELVEDYDYEGLELDWLRCPFCVDAPAPKEKIDTITKWHGEVRELTRTRARQTGKPYPLGLRIPCRLGQLRAVGLDVKAMVDDGIVDFVNFSNSWQTTWDVPYDQLRRELGEKVAFYGVIEDAPNWLNVYDPKSKKKSNRLLTTSPELLRGNAAGKLVMGVDGIETFNFFCSDEFVHDTSDDAGLPRRAEERPARYPMLRGLDRLDELRGNPKHYALATRQGPWQVPLFEYADQVPVLLEPDRKQAFRLTMSAEPADRGLELVVQVVTERTEKVPDLGVSFNGSWPSFAAKETDRLLFPAGRYTHHAPEHRAFDYHLEPSAIRDGWNEILVFNGSHQAKTAEERRSNTVNILSVEVAVKKKGTGE
jgi:hypothetical protein